MSEIAVPNAWYVVLSFEILTNKDLTDKEKLVLALIGNLQNQKGFCFASNQYMGDLLNCKQDTISEVVSSLVKQGWLNRQIFRNDKKEITHRALMIKLKKNEGEIFTDEEIPLSDFTGIPPYPGKPGDLSRQTGKIITKINNSVVATQGENLFELPELEEVKLISAAAKKNTIWIETMCSALHLKKQEMFDWMDLFDLSISSSETVRGLTARKYNLMCTGWIRKKNADGHTLESFKKTQISENGKNGQGIQTGGGRGYGNGPGNTKSNSGRYQPGGQGGY